MAETSVSDITDPCKISTPGTAHRSPCHFCCISPPMRARTGQSASHWHKFRKANIRGHGSRSYLSRIPLNERIMHSNGDPGVIRALSDSLNEITEWVIRTRTLPSCLVSHVNVHPPSTVHPCTNEGSVLSRQLDIGMLVHSLMPVRITSSTPPSL